MSGTSSDVVHDVEYARSVSVGLFTLSAKAGDLREAEHAVDQRTRQLREAVLAWSERLSPRQIADAAGLPVDQVHQLIAGAGPRAPRLPKLPPLPVPAQPAQR